MKKKRIVSNYSLSLSLSLLKVKKNKKIKKIFSFCAAAQKKTLFAFLNKYLNSLSLSLFLFFDSLL
jgi:hypothetical protein